MSSPQQWSLPDPRPNQTFVTVSPIEGGFLTLPEWAFVFPFNRNAKRLVPSLAFFITHPGIEQVGSLGLGTSKRPLRIMFDLGTRSDLDKYLPAQRIHLESRKPLLGSGIVRRLAAGNISPEDIDIVLFSHVHWDHHGDPEDFPTSKFLVGSGTMNVLKHGIPGKGPHQHFHPDLLPAGRTLELPPVEKVRGWREHEWHWNPLGPFSAALDLLGDGSVFVIDSPGHLPR